MSVTVSFVGHIDPIEPADLLFDRIPTLGEQVEYRGEWWSVVRVRWGQDGPSLVVSRLDMA